MTSTRLDAVTGATGFSGRYITTRLLSKGHHVINLTGHPHRPHDFGHTLVSQPFNFDKTDELTESLSCVDTLYNTYWIRFECGDATFDRAIANSRVLIESARKAGVRRIVHTSITNPSLDSPLPYYRGKALVEDAIIQSGMSYAILRPNVLFGDQGILINNIAWFLRHLPAFGVPGDGEYKLQPTFVEDFADLAVEWGEKRENAIVDVVGPEIYSFNDLVKLLKIAVRSKAAVVHLPPVLALAFTQTLGTMLNDVVLTSDEVRGLLANLLVSQNPPMAPTHFSSWLEANQSWLGKEYFSEVKKHYVRP